MQKQSLEKIYQPSWKSLQEAGEEWYDVTEDLPNPLIFLFMIDPPGVPLLLPQNSICLLFALL